MKVVGRKFLVTISSLTLSYLNHALFFFIHITYFEIHRMALLYLLTRNMWEGINVWLAGWECIYLCDEECWVTFILF